MDELSRELCEVFGQLQEKDPEVAKSVLELIRTLAKVPPDFLHNGQEQT
jgi:hypothetical protein